MYTLLLLHIQPLKIDGNASISTRYSTLQRMCRLYTMRTCLSSLTFISSENTLTSFTSIPYRGSDWNKILPPHRFPTVGIVQ
jgi:hypothetical protein